MGYQRILMNKTQEGSSQENEQKWSKYWVLKDSPFAITFPFWGKGDQAFVATLQTVIECELDLE